jgi:hypothetical protein
MNNINTHFNKLNPNEKTKFSLLLRLIITYQTHRNILILNGSNNNLLNK